MYVQASAIKDLTLSFANFSQIDLDFHIFPPKHIIKGKTESI